MYDPKVEDAIGKTHELLKTVFARKVEQVSTEIQAQKHDP
jgi:hypothetical protein